MRPVIHGGDIYQNSVELDFSVNINPFGIPDGVRKAMREALNQCEHYPDIHHTQLITAISRTYGIPEEHILCGNGASELFVAIAHAIKPKRILIPVPSFFGYEKAAGVTDAEVIYYEMKEADGFCLTEEVLAKLTEETDLLFLANPNNPVGNTLEEKLLTAICDRCREKQITVVIDECFLEFAKQPGFFDTHAKERYPNVIVVKAFTKLYAIPGVRLGYLFCGDRALAAQIENQLPEWNISCIAEAAGIAALKEKDYCSRTICAIERERSFLMTELEHREIHIFPGEADFLLLRTKLPLYEKLLEQKILIRDCSNYRGLHKGYYRIAVKQHEENCRLLEAISNITERRKGASDGTDRICQTAGY